MSFIHQILITCLAFLILNCESPTDAPVKGTISGSVFNSRTGEVIQDAQIETDPFTKSVTTENDGTFLISSVPMGDYTVTALKDGYTDRGVTVTVSGGGDATADLVLVPATASIHGTITDAKTGDALESATISSKPVTKPITSDKNGKFEFNGIKALSYTLNFDRKGYQSESQTILLKGGDEEIINISLQPVNGNIQGLVLDVKTGDPLENAVITTIPATKSIKSDSAGFFELAYIPEGTYALSIESNGFGVLEKNIEVTGGESATAEFNLRRTHGHVLVTVTDLQNGRFIAGAVTGTDPETKSVTSKKDGICMLSDIAAGAYKISISVEGYATRVFPVTVVGGDTARVYGAIMPTRGSISGFVMESDGTTAISGAQISTEPATQALSSDSAGGFTFENVDEGVYLLSVEKTGYATARESLTVAGGKIAKASIELISKNGNCKGIITDAKTGKPVPGATITTTPSSHGVTSDSAGEYQLKAIPAGGYVVSVARRGYVSVEKEVNIVTGETALYNLVLVPSVGNLSGQVMDEGTDLPVEKAVVTTEPATVSVATDEQGHFTFLSIPTGSYTISAEKQSYAPKSASIVLEPGAEATASLRLARIPDSLGNISGRVTDNLTGNPLSGVAIATAPETRAVVTDTEGMFTMDNIPEGDYKLTATKKDYVSTGKNIKVMGGIEVNSDFTLNPSHGSISGKISDARTLNPLSGASITTTPTTASITSGADGTFTMEKVLAGSYTVNVTLDEYTSNPLKILVTGGRTTTANLSLTPSKGSVSGRITDSKTNNPLPGASVVTIPATATVTADATGIYAISGIALRDYEVTVSTAGHSNLTKSVSVKGGEIATLDFSLTPNRGSISGTITESRSGSVLNNVAVTTVPATLSVTSNAQGQFSIGPIANGSYTVAANLDGYTSSTKEVVVTAGETTTAAFVLTSKNGTITGKVTDNTGTNSLAGVVLTTSPATTSVTTDSNGDFIFAEVPPLVYSVKAVKEGYYDATTNINVTAAQTSSANLQLDEVLPTLSVSPATLNFSTDKTSLQFSITNVAGQGVLSYSIQKPAAATWLSLSRESGAIVDESDVVICTVDRSTLSPGNYLADLVVSSNGGGETVQAVMAVPDPGSPQLTVSKSLLDFGESANEIQFTLSNTGTGSLNYSIADDMDWLTTGPLSGTLNAIPAVITASVNRANLTQIKTYTGRITLSSNGGSAGIDVSLETASEPLDPVSLSFTELTSSGCRLSWTQVSQPSNFTAYEVYESSNPNFTMGEATKLATISAHTSLSYVIAGTEQTTRYYRVYTVNGSQAATSSNEIHVTFPAKLRNWTYSLNTSSNGYELVDIRSLDEANAWSCGWKGDYGVVLKWDNAARSWNEMTLPSNVERVDRLHPVSPTLVYAAGYGQVSGSRRAMILKYSAGAWSVLYTGPVPYNLYLGVGDLHVFNDNLIYSSWDTRYENVYKIESGVWNKTGINGWNIRFQDENTGYVSGEEDFIEKYNGYGWTNLPYTEAGIFGNLSIGSDGSLTTFKNNKIYIYSQDMLDRTLDPLLDGFECSIQTAFALDSTWIWAGGRAYLQSPHRLLHYNGSKFETVTIAGNPGFYRFWFDSKENGWALADNGIYLYR